MFKLTLSEVSKSYGPTHAFKKGDFCLSSGEVHALVGTNGSGKSTLCKIIAGSVKPDTGSIRINGKQVCIDSPLQAKKLGIGIFYQELSLAINRTIAENIFIADLPTKFTFLQDKQTLYRSAQKYIDLVSGVAGDNFRVDTVVADLRADQRQLVEILKTLATEAEILIFDEPTSALDRSQVGCLFDILQRLKAQGKAIIIISHRMDEIFEISDRLTVIRDGAIVATESKQDTSPKEIVSMMVGNQESLTPNAGSVNSREPRALNTILQVKHLAGNQFRNVSFVLNEGEILGFGGLHGQGQSAVLRALFGANPITSGTVVYQGKNFSPKSPRAVIRQGWAYVSGNRSYDGVIHGRSIFENTTPVHALIEKSALISPTMLTPKVERALEKLNTKFEVLSNPIDSLSGGNQQKVVIGRWLMGTPRVLLLDDPTKGIDLAAKGELFSLIRRLAKEGVSIIIYSSDDDELLSNADRILVFNGGTVSRELTGEARTRFNLYDAAYEVTA